jgi:hypothetical protein
MPTSDTMGNNTPADKPTDNPPDDTALSGGKNVNQTAADQGLDSGTVRALLDRLDALEKQKNERDRADAVAAGEPIPVRNTHVLVLANGDRVETACAAVTQVDTENDGVVPVVGCYELTGKA